MSRATSDDSIGDSASSFGMRFVLGAAKQETFDGHARSGVKREFRIALSGVVLLGML